MTRCSPSFAAAALLAALLPAQADEVLALRRGEDRPQRDALYRALHEQRVDVDLEAASLQDLARFLVAASGEVVNFVPWTKQELEPITLRLKRARLTAVMDVAQRMGGVRFVYAHGMVLIQHPDEVVEHTSLRCYGVAAATMRIPSFPGPDLRLVPPGEEALSLAAEDEPGPTASGFDADQLVDLIRTHVLPESWDENGVSISHLRGVLWVRQTETGHRKVAELLQTLGVIRKPRRVAVPDTRPAAEPAPAAEPQPESEPEPRREARAGRG